MLKLFLSNVRFLALFRLLEESTHLAESDIQKFKCWQKKKIESLCVGAGFDISLTLVYHWLRYFCTFITKIDIVCNAAIFSTATVDADLKAL